jgi:DNA-binding PadR family transcriptional regulator
MSAARMLVLGVVRQLGTAHGYQVRRELLSRRADEWASVAPGSIYQAMRTLTKRGLLEQVATESAGGPERTVYRITPDGETEFFHLVRSAISDPGDGSETLNAAFSFLHLLDRSTIAQLLGYRVQALWARLVAVEPPEDDGKPPQVTELHKLHAAQIRAEIQWALDLSERVREGDFAFSGDH